MIIIFELCQIGFGITITGMFNKQDRSFIFLAKLFNCTNDMRIDRFIIIIREIRHTIQDIQPGIQFTDKTQYIFFQFTITGKA